MFCLCGQGQFSSSDRDSVPHPNPGATLVPHGFVHPVDLQKGLSHSPHEGISEELKMNVFTWAQRPLTVSGASTIKAEPGPTLLSAQLGFRRIPLSYGRHHGGHIVTWPGTPSVRVESAEEARVVRGLVARPECREIASQPLTVWYVWRGRVRRYTPDLAVTFASVPLDLQALGAEARCLVEVKPEGRARLSTADWEAKRHVIRAATGRPLILLSSRTAQGVSHER